MSFGEKLSDRALWFDPPAGNTASAAVVFLVCHNAIWEITARLIESSRNPDRKSHEALAAELTNHLVDGLVLTPGITATFWSCSRVSFTTRRNNLPLKPIWTLTERSEADQPPQRLVRHS